MLLLLISYVIIIITKTEVFDMASNKLKVQRIQNKRLILLIMSVVALFLIFSLTSCNDKKDALDDGAINTEPVSENTENDLTTTTKIETTAVPTTEAPMTEASETTKKTDTVAYSTNTKDTVKDGNKGIYSYKSRGGIYDNYYIIDFDEGYVYFFSDGNGDTTCDRLRIDSGDLNNVLIITYHDGSDVWSYGLHFKWKNQPDHLILQDNDGFEYDYYTTKLDKALKIKDQKTIHDY